MRVLRSVEQLLDGYDGDDDGCDTVRSVGVGMVRAPDLALSRRPIVGVHDFVRLTSRR